MRRLERHFCHVSLDIDCSHKPDFCTVLVLGRECNRVFAGSQYAGYVCQFPADGFIAVCDPVAQVERYGPGRLTVHSLDLEQIVKLDCRKCCFTLSQVNMTLTVPHINNWTR